MQIKAFAALAFLYTLSGAAASLAGSPPTIQDVWVPRITYHTAGNVWRDWAEVYRDMDTRDASANLTSPRGSIHLRKDNYTTPLVLEDDFNVLNGKREVELPNLVAGTNYQIVPIGDSGNFSPEFTITSKVPY